jgi:hypothetical protein
LTGTHRRTIVHILVVEDGTETHWLIKEIVTGKRELRVEEERK